MKVYLYWIHYDEHINPWVEGYIGVTKNFSQRMDCHSRHKNFMRDKHLVRYTILHVFYDESDCLNKEKEYRPDRNIGWNIDVGGRGWFGGGRRKSHDITNKINKNKLRGSERTDLQKLATRTRIETIKSKNSGVIPGYRKGLKGSRENNGMSKKVYIDDIEYANHSIAKEALKGTVKGISTLGQLVKKYKTNRLYTKQGYLRPHDVELKLERKFIKIMTPQGEFDSMKEYREYIGISESKLDQYMKKYPKEYYRI